MDANPLTAGWRNARAPVQTAANGRVNVAIEQTGEKAILNWETFNVGRNTTVQFRQDPNWAVLNRVNDPKARPSQIKGQIKADGTVMIVNRNGVVFDGGAQVNVRNLVAAAIASATSSSRTTACTARTARRPVSPMLWARSSCVRARSSRPAVLRP